MNWTKIQPWLDKLTNYSHTAIGTVYAVAVLLYHFQFGKELGRDFVYFSGYFFAFLLGHAAAYQKWPDKQDSDGDKG